MNDFTAAAGNAGPAHSYQALRRWLPARLLYHPDFFRVRKLLAQPRRAAQTRALAGELLRQVLATAVAQVPFYRRSVRLSAAELAHEPPHELLACFPYLEKAEVLACQHDFLAGRPSGMWRNKRLADIEHAFVSDEWGKFGFHMDQARTLRSGADTRRLAHERPLHRRGNRLLLSPCHIEARHRGAILAAINRFRPAFVHATPSAAAALAALVQRRDLDFDARAVLLASEPASGAQLAAIEGLFGCPISLSHRLAGRTGLAFAEHRHGMTRPYRFQPLYGWSENRAEGARAEIVGTSLWNDLMPLIRYRSGDYGRLGADGECEAIDAAGA